MKKILALVLALVMTMSLATISSGAAYSDADKVQYTDAVNMMSTLGVMGGYADGSIRPQADVTRGAAAKMVAMVATGSNATTVSYYKGTASFEDVPASHTFADVVAFCVARGIVDGYGDGTYGVADNVKGWAVAKMVMVAMGYDAEAFGLTGKGAALNTITLASSIGLFNGMKADFVATEAASREECAQIIYNALNLKGVKKGAVTTDGNTTYVESEAKLIDKYSTVKTGVVVENGSNKAGATTTTLSDGTVLAVATGLDLVGHMVQYADSKAYSKDGVVPFAVVDLSSEIVVADGVKTLDAKAFKALFGAETVADNGAVVPFSNYAKTTTGYTKPASGADVVDGTYVFADNKVVSFLATTNYEIGSVKAYKAGTAKANGSVEFNSISANSGKWNLYTKDGETNTTAISLYDGIAVNDAVAIQQTGNMYTATKLSTVSGKVTAINTASGSESLTIGGKVYAVNTSLFTTTNTEVGSSELAYAWASSMNNDVVAYLDLTGAVVALIKPVEATTDAGVVYVTGTYDVAGAPDAYGKPTYTSYYVQAVDLDGKEVSYLTADDNYGGAKAKTIQKVVMVYDSTLKTNVATFVDANVEGTVAAASTTLEADIAGTSLKIEDGAYYASGVKFIYVDGSLAKLKTEVKTGAQKLASGTAIDVYATKALADKNWTVQYVFVEGTFSAENVKSTDIVYVASTTTTKLESYTTSAGVAATAYVYDVYINGELKSVKSVADKLTAGFNTYEIDADGMYILKPMSEGTILTGKKVSNLYGTLLTVDALVDVEAKDAKIVDVYYALNSYANPDLEETTTLTGLFGATNATVSVVYSEANGVKTINTIYVTAQAVAE